MSIEGQIDLAIRLCFWSTVLFPVIVAPIWHWWHSWWGRNIVSFDLSITVTLLPSWLYIVFPPVVKDDVRLWQIFQLVGLYLVVINLVWRVIMIVATQMAGRREDREAKEKEAAATASSPETDAEETI